MSRSVLLATAILCATAASARGQSAIDVPDHTVEVLVSIVVIDVAEIDDAAQTFRVDLHLSMRWRDERLADPTEAGLRRRSLFDIWHPEIGFANQRDGALLLPTEVTIDPQGNVVYRQRFGGTLSARFDLRDFPFDHQTLPIIVVSLLYGPDRVSLVVANTGSGADSFTVPGWDVDLGEAESGEMLVPALGSSFSRIDLPLRA